MVRLGVIGYGNRIHGVIDRCLRQVDPDVRVVGVVDPDQAGVRARLAACDQGEAAFYDSLEKFPFNVMVRTMVLEKPVAITMEQATAL